MVLSSLAFFHVWDKGHMRFWKFEVLSTRVLILFSMIPSDIVDWELLHIWTFSPFKMTFLPVNILFQIYKDRGFDFTFVNCSFLQYFGKRKEAIADLGWKMILQACLLIRALFIISVFLILTPPFAFVRQMEYHIFKWSFLSLGSWPHQNPLMILSIWL